MDTIFLSGLTTECIIGIWDWERKVKQKVVVDLEMAADIRKAAASDQSTTRSTTRRYRSGCCSSSASREFQLVETLTERIAQIVITEFDVPAVKVRLTSRAHCAARATSAS